MSKIQAIRGMRDVLPDETPMWQWLERKFHQMAFQMCIRDSHRKSSFCPL